MADFGHQCLLVADPGSAQFATIARIEKADGSPWVSILLANLTLAEDRKLEADATRLVKAVEYAKNILRISPSVEANSS
jgi:hypothetical protein